MLGIQVTTPVDGLINILLYSSLGMAISLQRPLARSLIYCVFIAAPLLVLWSTHSNFPKFSPIDEGAHYDYVERIYSDGVPIMGELMLPSSLNDIACYGVGLDGLVLPACNSVAVTAQNFPGGALQYEAQQPPLYYLYVATIAPVLEFLGLGSLGSMRLSGVFLLILSNFLILLSARAIRVPMFLIAPVLLAVNFSPVVAYHQTVVSNDAAILPIASLITYLILRTQAGSRDSIYWWIGLGLVGGFTKGTVLILCGIALLFSLSWSFTKVKSTSFSVLRQSVFGDLLVQRTFALLISAFFASGFWAVFVSRTTQVPLDTLAPFEVLRGGKVTIQLIMNQALVGLRPLTQSFAPFNGVDRDLISVVNFFVDFSLLFACAAGIFLVSRTWWSVTGPLILLGQYLGTIALGISFWLTYNINPGLSSRYGLSVVPLMVLVLCAGIQRKYTKIGVSMASAAIAGIYAVNILTSA